MCTRPLSGRAASAGGLGSAVILVILNAWKSHFQHEIM